MFTITNKAYKSPNTIDIFSQQMSQQQYQGNNQSQLKYTNGRKPNRAINDLKNPSSIHQPNQSLQGRGRGYAQAASNFKLSQDFSSNQNDTRFRQLNRVLSNHAAESTQQYMPQIKYKQGSSTQVHFNKGSFNNGRDMFNQFQNLNYRQLPNQGLVNGTFGAKTHNQLQNKWVKVNQYSNPARRDIGNQNASSLSRQQIENFQQTIRNYEQNIQSLESIISQRDLAIQNLQSEKQSLNKQLNQFKVKSKNGKTEHSVLEENQHLKIQIQELQSRLDEGTQLNTTEQVQDAQQRSPSNSQENQPYAQIDDQNTDNINNEEPLEEKVELNEIAKTEVDMKKFIDNGKPHIYEKNYEVQLQTIGFQNQDQYDLCKELKDNLGSQNYILLERHEETVQNILAQLLNKSSNAILFKNIIANKPKDQQLLDNDDINKLKNVCGILIRLSESFKKKCEFYEKPPVGFNQRLSIKMDSFRDLFDQGDIFTFKKDSIIEKNSTVHNLISQAENLNESKEFEVVYFIQFLIHMANKMLQCDRTIKKEFLLSSLDKVFRDIMCMPEDNRLVRYETIQILLENFGVYEDFPLESNSLQYISLNQQSKRILNRLTNHIDEIIQKQEKDGQQNMAEQNEYQQQCQIVIQEIFKNSLQEKEVKRQDGVIQTIEFINNNEFFRLLKSKNITKSDSIKENLSNFLKINEFNKDCISMESLIMALIDFKNSESLKKIGIKKRKLYDPKQPQMTLEEAQKKVVRRKKKKGKGFKQTLEKSIEIDYDLNNI
eukprot:403345236